MPYRRRYYMKRFRRRRRRPRKRGYKLALKLAKKALSRTSNEHKTFDTSFAGIAPTWSGLSYQLNNIAQGSTGNTRVGDNLKMKTLMMRMDFTATADTAVRMIIFYDKQRVIFNPSDILDAGYLGTVNAVNAPKDIGNFYRSKILLDRTFMLNLNGTVYKRFKKLLKINLYTQFDATTATQTTGRLVACFVSDQTPAVCVITGVMRLSYLDN